jgi:hypothetical protein
VLRGALLLLALTACRIGFDARTTGDSGADADSRPDVAFGNCWSAWRTRPLSLSAPATLSQLDTPTLLEGDPWLAPDALSLYFGQAGDFFVATRADRNAPFDAPTPQRTGVADLYRSVVQ